MTTPKIYNNIEEVLKLYPNIYYENDRSKNSKLKKFSDELYVSPNVFESVWEQSYNAAKNTLSYLSNIGVPFGIKFYVAVFEVGKLKHFVKSVQVIIIQWQLTKTAEPGDGEIMEMGNSVIIQQHPKEHRSL
jgi:hypothetical protein